MLTVAVALTQVSVEFASLFSKRGWEHAQMVVVGALLAPGKRTVTAVLLVMGLSQDWGLPFLTALCPSARYHQQWGNRTRRYPSGPGTSWG